MWLQDGYRGGLLQTLEDKGNEESGLIGDSLQALSGLSLQTGLHSLPITSEVGDFWFA